MKAAWFRVTTRSSRARGSNSSGGRSFSRSWTAVTPPSTASATERGAAYLNDAGIMRTSRNRARLA